MAGLKIVKTVAEGVAMILGAVIAFAGFVKK